MDRFEKICSSEQIDLKKDILLNRKIFKKMSFLIDRFKERCSFEKKDLKKEILLNRKI